MMTNIDVVGGVPAVVGSFGVLLEPRTMVLLLLLLLSFLLHIPPSCREQGEARERGGRGEGEARERGGRGEGEGREGRGRGEGFL